jgi:hypothetical protein
MLWIYNLPLWVLCALIQAVCIAYALVAVLAVRRLGWRIRENDNGVAAALHAFVGVLYAVALGLLVAGTHDDFQDVERSVSAEANATGDLFRVMSGLEPANRDRMQAQLGAYVLLVINREWPAAGRAEESPETWRAMDHLADDIYTFRPSSPQEERVYPQLTQEIGEVLDARRDRLFLGERGVDTVTWIIIILGGMITVAFAAFFRMENRRAQLLLTSMMALMFGLMLFLIAATDHPLWGRISVDPGPFKELVVSFARQRQELNPAGAPVVAGPWH